MRKIITLLIGTIALMNMTFALCAKEATLIDFDKLKANGNGYDASKSLAEDDADITDFTKHPFYEKDQSGRSVQLPQHMPTLIDYSSIAGSNFTEDETNKMRVSLSAYNWNVILNSSSATVTNLRQTKTIEWHSKVPANNLGFLKEDNTDDKAIIDRGGFNVLGVRIHFPESPFNNWALITPPFEIPAYEDIISNYKGELLSDEEIAANKGKGAKFLNGKGVIRNIDIIKSMSVRIYGCQFRNSFAVLLKDQDNVVTEYDFPQYLDFDGWKEISWRNPNYIDNVQNRALYVIPLYPRSEPYIKLDGFRVYRQGDQVGGDFVFYLKDVKMVYDEALIEKEYPIDHESAWGILYDRTQEAKKREFDKIGRSEILKYLESQKMDQSE